MRCRGRSSQTFKNTLQISILGTFLCLVIGFPFAYWLAVRVNPKWRGLLLGLVIVPFWTNFLVRTIGWRILLAPEGPVSGHPQGDRASGTLHSPCWTRSSPCSSASSTTTCR